MKLKNRPLEQVKTEVIAENFLFHNFFPKQDIQLQCETIVDDIAKSNLGLETQDTVNREIEPGEGEIRIISTGAINYSRDNVKTRVPTFMSMFILDDGLESRYYALKMEYSRDAFYDFIAQRPELSFLGGAFLAIEEKNKLNLSISKNMSGLDFRDTLKV